MYSIQYVWPKQDTTVLYGSKKKDGHLGHH
jgi:hypothetical protein